MLSKLGLHKLTGPCEFGYLHKIMTQLLDMFYFRISNDIIEPRHEISNNVVCATSNASDPHAHTRSLIRDFANRLNIL